MPLDVQQLSQYQTPQTPAPAPISPPPRHRWGFLAGFFVLALAISAGVYFFLLEKYQVSEIIPTYTPREIDPTAGWKTYTNAQYGFEISLPSSYTVSEVSPQPRQSGIYLVPLQSGEMVEYRTTVKPLLSIDAQPGDNSYVIPMAVFNANQYRFIAVSAGIEYGYNSVTKKWWQNNGNGQKEVTPEIVEINGWVGYKFSDGDAGTTLQAIAIPHGKFIFELTFISGGDDSQLIPSIDQILSTFKFTDATAGWKTHANAAFHFEFEYPQTWRVDDILEINRCCMDVYNSTNPFQGDSLKQNVMKAQFQDYHVPPSASESSFVSYWVSESKKSEMGPSLSLDSTVNLHTRDGTKIFKFVGVPGGIAYTYVIPQTADYSQVVNILVWHPDPLLETLLSTFKFTK
ncbi:MAG: hypothetical protein AAB479_01820 [Patescibacteria group bacterium]